MMKRLPRAALYIRLPDVELRWALRRAALDRRTDVRELVVEILTAWLAEAGYPVTPYTTGASHE